MSLVTQLSGLSGLSGLSRLSGLSGLSGFDLLLFSILRFFVVRLRLSLTWFIPSSTTETGGVSGSIPGERVVWRDV